MSKVVPGTVPKGRGTRRAGGRGAVAELRSSGTGWVGRPVSPGAGRASKSGPADRKAGREKQREPEIGAWSGEALSPRYQAQGRALGSFAEGLFWVVVSRDLTDSVQLQRVRIHSLPRKAQGTGVGSLSQWW